MNLASLISRRNLQSAIRNLSSALARSPDHSSPHRLSRQRRLFLESLESRQMLSTFTVLNTDDSGAGSLRQAILDANANPGPDQVAFKIGGGGVQTIQPITALPTVNESVDIDGTSQPGFAGTPLIELSGNLLKAPGHGLNILGGSSTIRGLVINRFTGSGVGQISLQSSDNRVEGNYLGTDVGGAAAFPIAGEFGIRLSGTNNVVGGTTAGAGNVISGNLTGIFVNGANNRVEGNRIGTTADGTAAIANNTGVQITGANNVVGGTAIGAGNLISGNSIHGVSIAFAGATGNRVEGNLIGTNAPGTAALGNNTGILITSGTAGNVVGGAAVGAGNVISGNGTGVNLNGLNNRVEGNRIGTNALGTAALANASGIVSFGSGNVVGGTASGAGNLISGNTDFGVRVLSTTGNRVEGNRIGTTDDGSASLGNGIGVQLFGASGNTIGGAAAGARNVISGNRREGVSISGAAATGNVVQGNYIGTNAAGTGALGNGGAGVYVLNAPSSTIGGTVGGAGNVISGNASSGVWVEGATATGTVIAGNLIGLNAAGAAALGNGNEGIDIRTNNNTIGGDSSAARNVISGNHQRGLIIQGGATGNVVQGNYIGTDIAGTSALGNSFQGVVLGGSNNTVGGTTAPASNTIAFNGADGVAVFFGTGNAIRGNSIHSNAGLGIDLNPDGVAPNDPGDADTGANNLQNYPVLISSLQPSVGAGDVSGTLNSTPNTTFSLDFYFSTVGDPLGFGEGRTHLFAAFLTTDAGGNASFSYGFPTTIPLGYVVTATATDPAGNTSEYSNAVAVTPSNRPPVGNADTATTDEDTAVTSSVLDNDNDPDTSDLLTVTTAAISNGALGTVTTNGTTVTYDPRTAYNYLAVGESAIVVIDYSISDGHGGSSSSSLTVTVTGNNDGPTAVNDSAATSGDDASVTINVLANDTDPDASDVLVVSGVTQPHSGQVVLNPDGTLTYTPGLGCDCTSDSFTYTISDGRGGTSQATVTITIGQHAGVSAVGGILRIGGTGSADVITVSGNNLIVNNVPHSLTGVTEVRIWGRAGDDRIDLSGLNIPALIDGGRDKDTLTGGSADDVIFGGLGDDIITGAAGHDFLIGGAGQDRIVGSAGHDILAAGDLGCGLDLMALRRISNDWASSRTALAAESIEAALGDLLAGGDFDQLTGSAGADLFFIDGGDKITDYHFDKPNTNKDGDVVISV